MISIYSSFDCTGKLAGRSVASTCSLDISGSALNGTGLPGVFEMRRVPVSGLGVSVLPVLVRNGNERPMKALAAGVAEQAKAYALAAASAGAQKQQTTHDHEMWAFRGPEPWSYPA